MHINEKIDLMGGKLVETVENLQEIKNSEENYNRSIGEILSVALHYCDTLMTIKDLSKKISLSFYKEEILKQLNLIEEFIDLTSDIKKVS
jgi:hypothetical protein